MTAREPVEFDHPVIDADGHVIELMPVALPYLREALGSQLFEQYRTARRTWEAMGDLEERRRTRIPQSAWWGNPAANTLDLATVSIPRLLHERLPEMGIDFAVLYPTRALGICRNQDPEMRTGLCRGWNDYFAEVYGPYSDRMAVAGIIPMNTVEEALAEIDHCVEIGLKVVGIPEGVWRPIEEPRPGASAWHTPGQTHWFDTFGLDTELDYDRVWARLVEAGMPLVSHGGLGDCAPSPYTSITNYSHNHVGAFGQKMYALCRSLYFGGVTRRFPTLSLGFLECGVGWAANMLSDIIEHWEKRRLDALAVLDPATIDLDLLERLLSEHAADLLPDGTDLREVASGVHVGGAAPEQLDDWRHLDVGTEQELVDLFAPRMYFGCEADDATIAFAYSEANPCGATLQPVFSSDIGHWDVPDIGEVVGETWELVTDGVLTPDQHRALVFENPARLFTSMNPAFFEDTAVADAVRRADLAGPAPVG